MIGEAMKFIVEINAKDFFEAGTEVDQKQVTKAIESAVQQAMTLIDQKLSASRTEFDEWRRKGGRILKMMESMIDKEEVKVSVNVRHNEPFTVQPTPARTARQPADHGSNGHLPVGEASTLAALIQYNAGLRREQLTVLTGYKRSTRDAYIARLRERGFVGEDGGKIIVTQEGMAALPDAQPLPSGEELQAYWLQRLPEGERRILEILLAAFPNPADREQLTDQSGYKRSTRDAYLSRLESKELIEQAGRGMVRASPNLFDVTEAAR
jgi:chromosome segregation and condensation protein ScpB